MCTFASGMLRRLLSHTAAPLLALVLVSLLSLGVRLLLLDEPCASPCTTASEHTLIFDEAYYVQAARVIAGIRPPSQDHYSSSPLGTDPNAEHPSGAKLIMAAAIEIFGDGPFAWRIGSVLMGSIAILGMFALVRSAGGGRWPAVGAAALMASDNLLLVHGRIGTLDIYVVAMMVWAVAFYLRGRPLIAGIVLAVGLAFKEVGVYALAVLALVEIGRLLVAWRHRDAPADWRPLPALGRLLATTISSMCVFVGLLAVMGQIATPYADADAKLITGGPFAEIAHIISYGANLTSPNGPQGIASYPWDWLIDLKPIDYLTVNPSLPGAGIGAIHPVVAFYGEISPPILLLGMLALGLCVYRLARRRRASAHARVRIAAAVPDSGGGSEIPAAEPALERPPAVAAGPPAGRMSLIADRQLAILSLAWFIGCWAPFAIQCLVWQRTSYLYYMVVVMPGLYVSAMYAAELGWRRGRLWLRIVVGTWALTVLAAAVIMYPFVAVFR
jgi:Dolichyl-phosphate-mannose-protein mannosyltransferase